jgi:hypothetical protein
MYSLCKYLQLGQILYLILCKWQKITYLILYTQCNMDTNCCYQGLACVHCIFILWHMYPHFHLKLKYIAIFTPLSMWICGGNRIIVEFTTTSAIGVYHNWCCEFKSRSRWGVQHYVIKFVSDLRHVMVFSGSSTNKTDRHYITEILLKVALNNINVVLAWHICRQSELQTVYRIKYCLDRKT